MCVGGVCVCRMEDVHGKEEEKQQQREEKGRRSWKTNGRHIVKYGEALLVALLVYEALRY